MEELSIGFMETDIGRIRIAAGAEGVCQVQFCDGETAPGRDGTETGYQHLSDALRQLREYFKAARTEFSLKLNPAGTRFQREVWNQLRRIPYGSKVSYGSIASRMGKPGAARAVGRANATNPIAIVVPCHRVIGADGSMTGYASGIYRKRYLLKLEGAING